jgi:folate-binding Fe-S cluster repair protein YgfZ
LELNLDVLGGVDFKKGCFVGQETTSRMHRRGVVKNRLLPVTFEGPAPPFGAEVLSNGLRAGEMRGGVPGRGLALLRLDRIGGPLETAPGANAAQAQPLKLDPQPWAERLSARAGV